MTHARTASALVVATVLLIGCGGDDDFANNPRPPIPINVTAAITDQKVTVSPRSIGAGPVVMIIANETAQARRVTVETDVLASDEGGIRQQTAPINPQGTGTLKIDMRTGSYRISVDGRRIPDGRLKVGQERETAQDAVLQP